MDLQTEIVASYAVEVSGWNTSEGFFVEKTTLDWGHDTQQEIKLRSTVREGCVLFVRLLQPIEDATQLPVAYQAVRVKAKDADGWSEVTVAQMRPRASYKEKVRALDDAPVRVA